MTSGRGSFERLLSDDAALAAGNFEMELTRARRAPRTRRFTGMLALVAVFCAGAALTAGAGNVTVHSDEATTEAAATPDAAPAGDSAAPEAAPETPAAATEEPAAASEPVSAPEEQAAASEPAAPAAEPAAEPANPDELAARDAPVRAGYTPSAPGTAASAATTAAAPAPKRPSRATAASRGTESRPSPVSPLAESFVPAIPFDVQAWEHDNPGSSVGATAVAIAQHFVGTPYVWGGSTPSGGFDCSGLMLYVYGQLGISLPHYAASQFALFPHLAPSELRPGDLVFFEPKLDGPGHVAMYIGNDEIVEAPHTGALVRVGSLSASAAALGFMGAVRPYGVGLRSARQLAAVRGTDPRPGAPGTAFAV